NDNVNWGFDMWDTCNYYVNTAESGGLLTLLLLFFLIGRCFQAIGKARAAFEDDKHKQLLFWCIGAMLFAQCTAYFGIAYFDQSVVFWYSQLSIIVALTAEYAGARVSVTEATVEIKESTIHVPWRAPRREPVPAPQLRKHISTRTSS